MEDNPPSKSVKPHVIDHFLVLDLVRLSRRRFFNPVGEINEA